MQGSFQELAPAPSSFERVNKPREIEGVLDTFLIRPMGYLLVLLFRRTPVTPNMVSVASIFAALGAAACWYQRSLAGAVGGLAFLLLNSALDSADGQLARLTGRKTDLGRFLDGLCDNFSFVLIYASIVLSYAGHGGVGVPWVVLLGLVAGWSHSLHSALADFARHQYVLHSRGSQEMIKEKPERLAEQVGRARGWLERWFLGQHRAYAERQRRLLPGADRLQRLFESAAASRPDLAAWFSTRYSEAHRDLVKLWFWGATNVHKVGLVVFSFLPFVTESELIQRTGMIGYYAYDVALFVPVALVLRAQRRLDRQLEDELRARLAG